MFRKTLYISIDKKADNVVVRNVLIISFFVSAVKYIERASG